MNAVIYARYSSDKQRDVSIEDQIRECTEYAQANSLTVIKTYADRALSGTTDERAQFQLMIKDAAKKQFTRVLIYKTDRFTRNRFDAAIYKKKLKDYGVKVVPVKEPIPDGPGGVVMEALYESMAQMYSETYRRMCAGATIQKLSRRNTCLAKKHSADTVARCWSVIPAVVTKVISTATTGAREKVSITPLRSERKP